MIKHLSIKNLLLIDEIDIELNNGLCVLTGETGAGKSMILDSLSLISGERTKSSFRPDKGKVSSVTALIDISNFQLIKQKIQKGELIGFDRKGKIYSQFNGKVLMPLYQEQGNEGFYIIQHEK